MRVDRKAILIILILLSVFSIHCFAAIPPEQTTLDIHQVSAVSADPEITKEEIAAMIPTDIPDGSSEGTVSKMVLDKSLKAALKSDFVKNSSVKHTADSLKEGLNTEMAIGGSPTDPTAIQHKFKLKVDPMQAQAKIQYSGFLNASTTYHSGDVLCEITEDYHSYKLNLSHLVNDTEQLSLLQIQWAW
jgi:hypothetical protein